MRGHFTDYARIYEQHCKALEPISQSLDLVHAPQLKHTTVELSRPTGRTAHAVTPAGAVNQVQLYGEGAPAFFANLITAESMEAPPRWFRSNGNGMSSEGRHQVFDVLMRRTLRCAGSRS